MDAKEFRKARASLKLTQRELARAIGISNQSVWRIETARREIDPAEETALLKLLNTIPERPKTLGVVVTKLQAWMAEHNYDARTAAHRIGVSEWTLKHWLDGRFSPQPGSSQKILNAIQDNQPQLEVADVEESAHVDEEEEPETVTILPDGPSGMDKAVLAAVGYLLNARRIHTIAELYALVADMKRHLG